MKKGQNYKFIGIRQDDEPSVQPEGMAYSIKNFRIYSTGTGESQSLTLEKGTTPIDLKSLEAWNNPIKSLEGKPVGFGHYDKIIVIFSHVAYGDDVIYAIDFSRKFAPTDIGEIVYRGNLSFEDDTVLDILPFLENERYLKFYFCDGKNPNRVLSIDPNNLSLHTDLFDWNPQVPSIKLKATYGTISGVFHSGVIQYAITASVKHGQETPVIQITDCLGIYDNFEGLSPDATASCSFDIEITVLDKKSEKYDKINLYSIFRSSKDQTPEVKKVASFDMVNGEYGLTTPGPQGTATTRDFGNVISFTDTGAAGTIETSTSLLFKGGNNLSSLSLTQKDNTLFLGNNKVLDDYEVSGVTITPEKVKTVSDDIDIRTVHDIQGQIVFKNNKTTSKPFLHSGEWYRLGYQVLNRSGEWSNPVFLQDFKMPRQGSSNNNTDIITVNIPSVNLKVRNENAKMTAIRPVIVFPNITQQTVLCQGIISPTVFNIKDRDANAPFAQSSWFFRPIHPWLHNDIKDKDKAVSYNSTGAYDDKIYGAALEYADLYPIPDNSQANAEIQSLVGSPYLTQDKPDKNYWTKYLQEYYYIDGSIQTFHSPEIEFDEIKSLKGVDAYIIGASVCVASDSRETIVYDGKLHQTSESDTMTPDGLVPLDIKNTAKSSISSISSQGAYTYSKDSVFAGRVLGATASWIDGFTGWRKEKSYKDTAAAFVVYPWHNNTSFNNGVPGEDGGHATPKNKVLYNYRSAINMVYSDSKKETKISLQDAKIYEDDGYPIKLDIPSNGTGYESILYTGEIDVLSTPTLYNADGVYNSKTEETTIKRADLGDWGNGYPIVIAKRLVKYKDAQTKEAALKASWILIKDQKIDVKEATWVTRVEGAYHLTPDSKLYYGLYSNAPVPIQYKSSRHAVLAFGTKDQAIVPIDESDALIFPYTDFWRKEKASYQKMSSWYKGTYKNLHSYFPIVELRRPEYATKSPFSNIPSISNSYNWSIGGDAVKIPDGNIGGWNTITLKWTVGDTYYQRYECLKTYPFSDDAVNSIIDIVAFDVETRINLQGRYDNLKYNTKATSIKSNAFNQINRVYSQRNNYFSYNTLDEVNSKYPNSVYWSQPKISGANVDLWTSINATNNIELDTIYGDITAMECANNAVLAMQKYGTSRILYNEQTQLTTDSGIPIEIGNSGKVTGKQLVAKAGPVCKSHVVNTDKNLIFIDHTTKGLVGLADNINDISLAGGMSSWFKKLSSSKFSFSNNDTHKLLFDSDTNSILVSDFNNDTLSYSLKGNVFEGFFSYDKIVDLYTVNDKKIAIRYDENGMSLHNLRDGDYNSFFGESKGYDVSFIANPEVTIDKVFDTLEIRADVIKDDKTTYSKDGFFDVTKSEQETKLTNLPISYIKTSNAYQEGISTTLSDGNPYLRINKKFNVWRALMPRDGHSRFKRDRIRNLWTKISFGKEDNDESLSNSKVIVQDITINYNV